MAKLTFDTIEDFNSFLPMLLQLATANPDLVSDDAEEFYMRINAKIKNELKKYFLQNPSYRQQIKRFTAGLENGENIVMSIKADKQNETREQIYLKEGTWTPIEKTVMRHLGVENG